MKNSRRGREVRAANLALTRPFSLALSLCHSDQALGARSASKCVSGSELFVTCGWARGVSGGPHLRLCGLLSGCRGGVRCALVSLFWWHACALGSRAAVCAAKLKGSVLYSLIVGLQHLVAALALRCLEERVRRRVEEGPLVSRLREGEGVKERRTTQAANHGGTTLRNKG